MKKCPKCKLNCNDCDFSPSQLKKPDGQCRPCRSTYQAQYYQENKERLQLQNKAWQEANKEEIAEYKKNYAQDHKEEIAEYQKAYKDEHKEELIVKNHNYYQENKEAIKVKKRVYKKKKRKTDITFRVHETASSQILIHIQSCGGSKNGASINNFLPWTWQEFWDHFLAIMKLPGNEWMTPDNQGIYDPKLWDDKDQTTWKWQLDHIIPHSLFHYETMDCQEFRDCWALSNLRPLSAKQNLLDGVNRTRHIKK